MSLLTINKLTDSVGAEVLGVDPDRLATDDSLAAAVLEALEDNGVLVFPELGLDPEAQVAFCRRLGDIDHSSDGHHPVAGIYPITLDKSKNASAAYLRATFDWHIDGCTPIEDTCPQMATVLSALQVADRGGETEFASSYAAYDALTDDGEGAVRVAAGRALARGLAAPGHPGSLAGGAGAVAVPAHPRAPAGVDASQRPQVAGARRVGRLHRRHGPRRGHGRCSPTCSTAPPGPTRCTATTGRSATPSSGTTAASCTARHRTTPARRARCCARPCWATSRSSDGPAAERVPKPPR